MGTKYTTISISNYNASPPPDDGSQVSANKVDWSKVKTKIGDPLQTAITSINSSLVQHFDVGPTLKTATYTTVAADYGTVLEVTGTTTITLLAAATGGSGYNVTVKNSGSNTVTVASSDNIDGNASITLQPDNSATFMVDAAGTTYHMLPGRGLQDVFTTRGDLIYEGASGEARLAVGSSGQVLKSDGTDPVYGTTVGGYSGAQATTSGTTVAYASIPTWARRIDLTLDGVSLNGNDDIMFQLGDATTGGYITSGYIGSATTVDGTPTRNSNSTAGYLSNDLVAGDALSGAISIIAHNSTGTNWTWNGVLFKANGLAFMVGGAVDTAAACDRIQLLTNGANSFDAGEFQVSWS